MTQPDKRFLVIVRAGDASLHPGWTRSPATRTWDLVVSYFGNDPARYRNDFDRRIDDKGQKWQGLHALLTRTDFWRDYDYVWLPDDDLAADEATVNRLFALMDGLDLEIAQPTLDWNSHYGIPMTLHWPGFSVRLTNFVEIMAPCFSRKLLATALPTFSESLAGWGFDFIWPRLLGDGIQRAAMLDDVTVTHTRAVGGPTYDRLKAMGIEPATEGRALLRRFGVPKDTRMMITASIDRSGRFLHGGDPGAAAAMTALMHRDWDAIIAYRNSVAPGVLGTPLPTPALPGPSIADLGALLATRLPRA